MFELLDDIIPLEEDEQEPVLPKNSPRKRYVSPCRPTRARHYADSVHRPCFRRSMSEATTSTTSAGMYADRTHSPKGRSKCVRSTSGRMEAILTNQS